MASSLLTTINDTSVLWQRLGTLRPFGVSIFFLYEAARPIYKYIKLLFVIIFNFNSLNRPVRAFLYFDEKRKEKITVNEKEESMRSVAREKIIDVLENGIEENWTDLHNEAFNTDYYEIYTDDAIEALNEYGIFEALKKIRDYELERFGELYTDISNPVDVVNMLFYVIGGEVLDEYLDYYDWPNQVNDIKAELIEAINADMKAA